MKRGGAAQRRVCVSPGEPGGPVCLHHLGSLVGVSDSSQDSLVGVSDSFLCSLVGVSESSLGSLVGVSDSSLGSLVGVSVYLT